MTLQKGTLCGQQIDPNCTFYNIYSVIVKSELISNFYSILSNNVLWGITYYGEDDAIVRTPPVGDGSLHLNEAALIDVNPFIVFIDGDVGWRRTTSLSKE